MSQIEPVLQFKSHIEGKNADVSVWPDRIEWSRQSSSLGRAGLAAATGGLSLFKTGMSGKKDTNMIPIRMIQGVTTQKSGLRFTVVKVTTAGDTVEFHVSKTDAENVKATITNLMLQGPTPSPAAAAAPPAGATPASVADELKKLAELRDSGVLSADEFETQKARLLN
jgi:hypothetical protein